MTVNKVFYTEIIEKVMGINEKSKGGKRNKKKTTERKKENLGSKSIQSLLLAFVGSSFAKHEQIGW